MAGELSLVSQLMLWLQSSDSSTLLMMWCTAVAGILLAAAAAELHSPVK
jgi:hypothetical protein